MYIQDWKLSCKISANLILINQSEIRSLDKPFPSIKKFILYPELTESGQQSGVFELIVCFELSTTIVHPPFNEVVELGKSILQYYINLLAFLTVYPIKIITPITLTHDYPNTNKHRFIQISQLVNQKDPISLAYSKLFSITVDPKLQRLMSWFRKGLEETDVINSLLCLNVSLEMLSNQFNCPCSIIKTCSSCGNKVELKPGLKQKVEYLLTEQIGYSTKQFLCIWNNRNILTHGGVKFTSDEMHEMSRIKHILTIAILRGIKILLALDKQDIPHEPTGIGFCDPIIDIEYTDPIEKTP